jgi:hypothetical protein
MQDYNIERVGQPDLVFNGDLIGQSAGANRVKLYRTKGGKFIAQLSVDAQRSHAAPFDKPADLITWLKSNLNSITPEAQVAIEEAAKKDEAFKKFWTERVE